jgi:hypothetical protein
MDLANAVATAPSRDDLRQGQWRFDCDYEDQRMRPIQEPFKKTATIYKSEKFISVEPLSGANIIQYREDENYRVYLEPAVTDEVMGRVLLAALDRSRFVDDDEFYNPDRAMRIGRKTSCADTVIRPDVMRIRTWIGAEPNYPAARFPSSRTVATSRITGKIFRRIERSSFP